MIEQPAHPASRNALTDSEPFRALRPRLVDQIFEVARERRFDTGEIVIRQGQRGNALFVIVDGTADVVVHDHEGTARTIGDVLRGSVLGEMSLITQEPATADVVASSPLRVLVVSSADFDQLAGRNPELTIVMTNLVADRLGRALHDGLGGKVLNGYRILRCVGRGGMAVVYEATELATGQRVALKMMSHRLVYQPGAFSRFEREARIVEPLTHPNIARMRGHFPAFRTQFIVMDFCEGGTLSELLKRYGPFPEDQVRPILGQLAAALTYVHQQSVVHRDLKPGNVMLTPEGRVKLMDFGLAKEQRDVSDDTATQEGSLLGTPFYMPPERISGEGGSPLLDTYAFACIAYELLSAKRFFEARSMMQLLHDKVTKMVPPADEIGSGISPAMHRLIVSGLEKDPAKRLAFLGEVVTWRSDLDPDFLEKLFPKTSGAA